MPPRAVATSILLLPGTLCDEKVFQPLLNRLPMLPARCVELAGADSANAMARLILADAPRRFALVGFSLGGIVALEIAALAPERVVGLALIATNPAPADQARAAARRAMATAASAQGVAEHVRRDLLPTYSGTVAMGRACEDLILGMARQAASGSYREQTEIALTRPDNRRRLTGFEAPTLVLGGDADRVTPIALQRAIEIPGATFATIAGAGHFVLLERPDTVALHIHRWCAQLALVSANTATAL